MKTTIENPLTALREKYKSITGKRAFPGWKEGELTERIKKFSANDNKEPQLKKTWEEMTEEERIAEAKRSNSRQVELNEKTMIPVYLEGGAFAIIGDKYIPWAEAQVVWQERKIEAEQERLMRMKADLKSNQS